MRRALRRPLRLGGDLLLILPALLLVAGSQVLWLGARQALRGLGVLALVRAAGLWLRLLPPYAALPVFLVPDLCSHATEVGAGVLLARGHVIAATGLAVIGKALATVIVVWIYRACEPALLRIAWFARLHRAAQAIRAAALAPLRPVVTVLRWKLRRTRRRLFRPVWASRP